MSQDCRPASASRRNYAPARGAPLVELASGVDTLYVSGRCTLPAGLLDGLEAQREIASTTGGPVALQLGGYDWQLKPTALHRYRYWLSHPLVDLGVTNKTGMPTLYAQFRAEGIHSLGADGVVHWATSALANEGITPDWLVSRIDLHADWQNWQIGGDDRHRFVCRSRGLTTYEDDFELSGFSFGSRSSKTVTARIYDKTREVEGNGHDWWIDIWGSECDPDVPVLRTEFEFHRTALKEMGLAEPAETLKAVDRIWAYATQDWLTYRTPSSHADSDRWPLAPEWQQIQRATLAGDALPIARICARRAAGGLRTLMPGLNGYVVGFAAWTGHDTIEAACAALPDHLRAYEHRSRRAFCSRVAERRQAQQ